MRIGPVLNRFQGEKTKTLQPFSQLLRLHTRTHKCCASAYYPHLLLLGGGKLTWLKVMNIHELVGKP